MLIPSAPKSGSVLPYPPAFLLVVTFGDGDLEFALRFAICTASAGS